MQDVLAAHKCIHGLIIGPEETSLLHNGQSCKSSPDDRQSRAVWIPVVIEG